MSGEEWAERMVRSGLCPICGRGPFKVPAIHVSKAHGVDRRTLRDMMGVNYRESICDPDYSAELAERARLEDRLGDRRGGKSGSRRFSKAAKGRLADLARRRGEERLAAVTERDQAIAEAIRSRRLTYAEIAVVFQVHEKTVANVARRSGIPATGAHPPRPRRLCSIEGCGLPHKGHGLCRLHLRRSRSSP